MNLKPEIKLLIFLSGLFVSSILLAELIGVKLFSLEETLGFKKLSLTILGQPNLSLTLSVGVLTWPIVFILTDIINDYFGYKTIKTLSVFAVIHISVAFIFIFLANKASPDTNWWLTSQTKIGIPNMNHAFNTLFGQGLNIIIASIIAFFVGQLVDSFIFKKIKQTTGDRFIWLRSTVSTLISQFLDSIIVTLIAFYLLSTMPLVQSIALALTAYLYKFIVAILATPFLYLVHYLIEIYLGTETAYRLRKLK